MERPFKAGVQYGDWEGTSAADDAGDASMRDYLLQKKLIDQDEFLIGLEMWIGENHGGNVRTPRLSALVKKPAEFETLKDAIDAENPVSVREINYEMSLEEFFGLYKCFSIAISRRGLEFTNRDYITDD